MINTVFKETGNLIVNLSTTTLTASISSVLGVLISVTGAGLSMGYSSHAAALTDSPKPVVSCRATKAGRQYVRVNWTPANADNADRYTIRRSLNGGNYNWKSTESKHARSSIVTERNTGNLRYQVETITAAGVKTRTTCGPNAGLNHDLTSTPVAVASCWAHRLDNGEFFITWTARPNDGADRYTVMKSRNRDTYNWADTVGRRERESSFTSSGSGTYRFQVRTVARNGTYVTRDCGPETGVGSKLTVMPIGDSITLGATERPAYRYPMQQADRYKNCGIDLVGDAGGNWARGEAPSGQYAKLDHDHASWGGNTVKNLLDGRNILHRVNNFQPDVVLLHVGTNDILKGVSLVNESEPKLRAMIDGIKQQSPNTTIFVAKVIRPGAEKHQSRVDRWNSMVEAVVASTGSKTRLVDMDAIWPRFTPSPQTQAQRDENERFRSLTMYQAEWGWDGVHPSIEGSKVLADQWLSALQDAGLCP